MNMFNASDIISTIKSKRIEWLGHIQRMARERGVKRIFEDKPGGRRRVGRPRLRWVDGVENDIRTMRVKRWRNVAKSGGELWRPGHCTGRSTTDDDDDDVV
jgi:hypothetical protein